MQKVDTSLGAKLIGQGKQGLTALHLGRSLVHELRRQVVDIPLGAEVFGFVDQILVDDPRVARFVSTGKGMEGHGAPGWRSWWRRVVFCSAALRNPGRCSCQRCQ